MTKFLAYFGSLIAFAVLWAIFFVGFGALFRFLWKFGRGDDPSHDPLRL